MHRLNKFAVPLIALGLLVYWILQRGPSYLSSYFAALEVQALQDAARIYSGRFIEYIPRHLHPPLTSAVLGLWTLLGDSETTLRLFPVACALGTLAIYTSLLRDKYGLPTAAVAALYFVCCWGFVVCHVGVLNYGWPLLLSMAMIWLYSQYLEQRQAKLLVALGVLTTIGVFSNYSIVFLAAALWSAVCIYDLVEQRRVKTASVVAGLLAIVPGALWMLWHKSQLPPDTAAYLLPLSLGGGNFLEVLLAGTSHFMILFFPYEWNEVVRKTLFLTIFLGLVFFKSGRSRWILLPTVICTAVFLVASVLFNFPWDSARHRFPLIALYALLIADRGIQTLLQVPLPMRKPAMATVGLITLVMAITHLHFPDWEAYNSKLRNQQDVAEWRSSLLADNRVVVTDQATWERMSWYITRQNDFGFHLPLSQEQTHTLLPFRVVLVQVWNFQKKESCRAVSDLLGDLDTYGGWRVTSLADMADDYTEPQDCVARRVGAHEWKAPSAFIVSYNLFYAL